MTSIINSDPRKPPRNGAAFLFGEGTVMMTRTLICGILMILCGCTAADPQEFRIANETPISIDLARDISSPAVYLMSSASLGTGSLPPNFLRYEVMLESTDVRGLLIQNQQLCLLFHFDGEVYLAAIADAAVPPGHERIAIQRAATAMQHRWRLSPARPITNEGGQLQVDVLYDTGRRRENLGSHIGRR